MYLSPAMSCKYGFLEIFDTFYFNWFDRISINRCEVIQKLEFSSTYYSIRE